MRVSHPSLSTLLDSLVYTGTFSAGLSILSASGKDYLMSGLFLFLSIFSILMVIFMEARRELEFKRDVESLAKCGFIISYYVGSPTLKQTFWYIVSEMKRASGTAS